METGGKQTDSFKRVDSFKVPVKESQHPVEMQGSIETVSTVWNTDELMFHAVPFQFLGHLDGLFKGYISILVAVKQHCRLIIVGNIPYGAERIERPRFLVRIVSDHFRRPQAVLPAVKVKATARITLSGGGSREWNGRLLTAR